MADPQLPHSPANGAAPLPETLVPVAKRQRRPSVRLGEIGDQPAAIPFEPPARRHHHKHWKEVPRPPSKSRPVTANLDPSDAPQDDPAPHSSDNESLEPLAVKVRRGNRGAIKSRRGGGARRWIRSGWASKVASKAGEAPEDTELKSSGGEDAGDDNCKEDSGSPSEKRDAAVAARVRAPDGVPGITDAAEGDTLSPSESEDDGEWNNNRSGRSRSVDDCGVRSWLNRLGLGRYAPVFEIHEVDDDVLPLLTLEDLKDMGINAVGSRRKIYCAIQKLRKGFT